MSRRTWLFVHVLGAMVFGTGAREAAAYSSPGLYAADPTRGGGGGRAFTGGPLDGYDCSVCHRGGPAPTQALHGGPGDTYTPGATYQFELAWPATEQLALTLEAADDDGAPLGSLQLPPRDLLTDAERCAGGGAGAELLALDERRVIGVGACKSTLLRFQWTAPDEPRAGALYVSLALGDGDGTPEGDGARGFVVPLTTVEPASGCAIDREGPPLFLLLLLLRRRWLLALLGALVGCARVQPHERGRLAKPDMQLTPDPDLTAGPEHALEYREGAVGGFSGGGGGCGCN